MKAVILAAGRGERLSPLTDKLPKPLLTLKGRSLIEHVLRSFTEAGVTPVPRRKYVITFEIGRFTQDENIHLSCLSEVLLTSLHLSQSTLSVTQTPINPSRIIE